MEEGEAAVASRPTTAARSRPATAAASRPATASTSRPATASGSRPATAARSRPTTSKSRPVTGRSRPATSFTGSRPGTAGQISRPRTSNSRPATTLSVKSAKVWNESETTASTPRTEGDDDDDLLIQQDVQKGCWHSFSHCVGGMWATREMDENVDKEIFVRTTIRELVIYIMFLVILGIVTMGMVSPKHFYYTKIMKDLFLRQKEVKNIPEFWEFMEGQFVDGLHWEYWYDEEDHRNYECSGGEGSSGPCPLAASDRNMLFENRILGLARLKQLRVKNDSCEIHVDFQNAIPNCWAPYDPTIEDKSDFFPLRRERTAMSAWSYQTSDEMGSSNIPIKGQVGEYSGHGSVQNLHSVKNESKAILHELKELLWINRGTRAVMIDFTVYNANLNLFCVINLFFEFPATGGVIPGYSYKTVKLLRYVDRWDHFVRACEFIYMAFIVYYVIEESLEIFKLKSSYFLSISNNMDLIVVLLSIVNQTVSLYTTYVVDTKLIDLLAEPDGFSDFGTLGNASEMFKSFVALCVFFSVVKLFKYISFNKTMTQLASTLSECGGDIIGFTVMFFIVFFAFAQLGYLLFGSQVEDFSTFDSAIFTLLRTILGDFDFNSIEQANRILGPIFFLCYVFFVFFVLLNMFLAIINDTYSEVKAEIQNQHNDFEISDYFKRGYNNMLGKVGMRGKAVDIENALMMANTDGEVTYEEVRQNLKKCNFSDMEIEMFFAKYDLDGDGIFNFEEGLQIMDDLENDKIDTENRPPSAGAIYHNQNDRPKSGVHDTINLEEMNMLTNRVDRMELVIDNIVSKIDMVLIKLESMEKSKSKRKENMSKILDGFMDG